MAGVCDQRKHYMIDAASRLPRVPGLVEREGYFVVHAPRQTGKTPTMRAIARQLTESGRFAALHFSCEAGQALGDDYEAVEEALLAHLRAAAANGLDVACQPPEPWPDTAPGTRLFAGLQGWAAACPLPLVLFFDEIDALRGPGLETVSDSSEPATPSVPSASPPPSPCAA